MTRITPTARLADVAMAAGVSKATASNVFNRPDLVRTELRERVLSVAKSLGYRGPDPRGRLLSAGRVNAIGVATIEPLAYFFEDPYASQMMRGISEACDAAGVGISLVSAASEDQLAWNLRSALVDGFILFCLAGTDKLIALARERGLPSIALGFDPEDATMSAVGIDNFAASRDAAHYLARLGHRRLAILALEFTPDGFGLATEARIAAAAYPVTAARVHGARDGLARFGIDPADMPVYETLSDAATVHAALEALYAGAAPPTALLAQSDRIALHALDWLGAHGLTVPGDVSIIGFDDVPQSAMSDPPLTTVRQPIAEIGRRAVRAILEQPDEIVRTRLATELVIRGSTAAPRQTLAQDAAPSIEGG